MTEEWINNLTEANQMTEEWLFDANDNRCSVEYFGSRKAAQRALDSLKNCKNCTNCSNCSYCSDCSRCSGLKNSKPSEQSAPPPVPKIESIHTKVYEAVCDPKHHLNMVTWHTCETRHCRAGWVVHLAGGAGRALEQFHNTELAAMLIYRESSPHLHVSPARFYDSNTDALADIKRMADLEKQSLTTNQS